MDLKQGVTISVQDMLGLSEVNLSTSQRDGDERDPIRCEKTNGRLTRKESDI